MNQKDVPTGLISEALTCWLSLLFSIFFAKCVVLTEAADRVLTLRLCPEQNTGY